MEILEQIKEKLKSIQKQKEELTEQLRNDFAPMLKPFFDKSKGKITSFGWTQYTPYFNDGDECTFGTNFEYTVYINGEDEDEIEGLDWRIKYYLKGDSEYTPEDSWDIELYKNIQEIKELLSSIPDDFYKDLFGDHVKVTIFADGNIKTEGYDHD